MLTGRANRAGRVAGSLLCALSHISCLETLSEKHMTFQKKKFFSPPKFNLDSSMFHSSRIQDRMQSSISKQISKAPQHQQCNITCRVSAFGRGAGQQGAPVSLSVHWGVVAPARPATQGSFSAFPGGFSTCLLSWHENQKCSGAASVPVLTIFSSPSLHLSQWQLHWFVCMLVPLQIPLSKDIKVHHSC